MPALSEVARSHMTVSATLASQGNHTAAAVHQLTAVVALCAGTIAIAIRETGAAGPPETDTPQDDPGV